MTDLKQRLRDYGTSNHVLDEAADRIEQLEAERDVLLADAIRYRWLRNGGDDDHGVGIYDPVIGDFCFTTWDSDLDAAIDAVIAKGEKHAQA